MLTRLVKVAAVPAVALALVWANPGIASAQEAGAITGSVVDSEGQPSKGCRCTYRPPNRAYCPMNRADLSS